MATINGTAINFGFTGTGGITITGVTGLLQSADLTEDGDMEEYRDGDGDLAATAHYNRFQTANLEILITGANLAGAITNTTAPAKGTFFAITACASMTALVANNWEVLEGTIASSNTSAARLNVRLRKAANITAVAT